MASIPSKDDAAPMMVLNFRWKRVKALLNRELIRCAIWLAAGVLVVGFFISHIYRETAERNLRTLLRAELYNVIGSVTIGDRSGLVGSPQLGDLRFTKLATGWYWLVEPGGDYSATPFVSPSIGASTLPVVSKSEVPFDENYERYYTTNDGFGNRVLVAETEVVLDTNGRFARFRVAGNIAVVENEVRNFSLRLYLALTGFGLGSLIVHRLASERRREFHKRFQL